MVKMSVLINNYKVNEFAQWLKNKKLNLLLYSVEGKRKQVANYIEELYFSRSVLVLQLMTCYKSLWALLRSFVIQCRPISIVGLPGL